MTQNVNPEAGQENTGKDQENAVDVKKLQADFEGLKKENENLIADRDKLNIEIRGFRSSAGDAAKLQKQLDSLVTDNSKLLSEIDGLKTAARDKDASAALQTALDAAGAKSTTTAAKLIDRSKIEFDDNGQVVQKSIDEAIAALKVSDSILFGAEQTTEQKKGPQTPAVQRAAQDGGKSDYHTELKAAREKRDGGAALTAVLRKYGKI